MICVTGCCALGDDGDAALRRAFSAQAALFTPHKPLKGMLVGRALPE